MTSPYDNPTVLVGLVGSGIQLSRTPAMHGAEGQRLGMQYVYRLLDTDLMPDPKPALAEILRAAELCGFAGLNITYPYKKQVIELLDELSDTARSVEAVNTVVFKEKKRIGHNTDMWGFARSFSEGMQGARLHKVLLIGAGGAGVAVAHALVQCGVQQLYLIDTQAGAAATLAQKLNQDYAGRIQAYALAGFPDLPEDLDGLINATPVGMAQVSGSPFPLERLKADLWVADIVYFPLQTELLKAAVELGCRVLPGSGMAVYQAYRAFELFSGRRPDSERMKAAFESFGS